MQRWQEDWRTGEEDFPAAGLGPSDQEWMGFLDKLLSIASRSASVASQWPVKFGNRWTGNIIGHRKWALCFKGIGEISRDTICTAAKPQHCNYVDNSNRGCVLICVNHLLWTSEATTPSSHPCTSLLKPGISCCWISLRSACGTTFEP